MSMPKTRVTGCVTGCVTVRLCAATLALFAAALPAHAEDRPAWWAQIDARALAVISDGDHRVSTYRDGRLAAMSERFRDVLTVIGLSKDGGRAEVAVSNSVTGPPEVMAVSPDSRFVYVIERLGQRTPTAAVVADLRPGTRVTAIDISDPGRPVITAAIDAGPMLESVRVSPDGRFLALTANGGADAVLQIVATRDGLLSAPVSFVLADLGVERKPGQPRGGIAATFADWHPSGRFLSVNLNTRNQIVFLALSEAADGRPSLQPWGAPVTVGRDPFVGRFTPDGGHYVSADWGRNFEAPDLEGRLPSTPSRLSLIKLAPREALGGAARHAVVASVPTEPSSEGLAISRDGRHIATVNMRDTALATTSARHTRQASISYVRFDPQRSALSKVGDYRFDGMLPEGGSFDRSGRHFIATVYEYADPANSGGGLEVWRVGDAATPGLTYLGRIPMPHGAHHVEIVP